MEGALCRAERQMDTTRLEVAFCAPLPPPPKKKNKKELVSKYVASFIKR
jgi:hypothetical protein